MKCNACWKNLEGRAVATTCGHIFCSEDAEKITSSVDSSCPMCEQMLSKSKLKEVDMAPSDEWINMVMAGVAPQSIMKCAFKGVNFWIEQKDVEVQLSVNKAGQFRQQCEQMQAAYNQKMSQVEEAYSAKLQQVQVGYQKAMKKIQGMEQEKEAIVKDKKEIQEKYTEKSRQKRKLEEMYDALSKEHELLKQSVAPSTPNNQSMVQRPNTFALATTFKNFDDIRHQPPALSGLPAGNADFWNPRQEPQPGPFDMPSLTKTLRGSKMQVPAGSTFNASTAAPQPSEIFRSLLRSPSTRRQRGRPRNL